MIVTEFLSVIVTMNTKTLFDLNNLSVKKLLTALGNTTSVNASAEIPMILILLGRLNSSIENLQKKNGEPQQGQSASTHGRRGRKRRNFSLGLCVGELVALKWKDLTEQRKMR